MDIIYEIRRRYSVQKQSISAIARDIELSRPTVHKHLNTITEPKYERVKPAARKLGQFEDQLTAWLEDESKLTRSRHRSVKRWKSTKHRPKITETFVPLVFQLGDAC
jgi:DNA-binding IclR family transcriptional regulator